MRTLPRAATAKVYVRLDTGIGATQLLHLDENIRALLLQGRPAFFAQLDRGRQWHLAGRKRQFADAFERRLVAALRIKIEADGFRELELGDAIIIPRGNQRRLLVGQSDFRLQDVESRHGPGFEAILLILQLGFQ